MRRMRIPTKVTMRMRTPLAKALIGRGVDEEAVVNRPKGEVEVVILKVWY